MHRILCALVCTVLSGLPLRADIYVFGDSLSDTGNVFAATFGFFPPRQFYFEGRFSNGPVWVEQLAEELGSPEDTRPAARGGNNFAVGGAETTALPAQLGSFVGRLESESEEIVASDLFVTWIGGNDLLNGEEADPEQVAGRIVAHLNALYALGARRFLVNNLPDLSQVPGEIGTPNAARTRARTIEFNTALARGLSEFASMNSGAEVAQPDIFTLFETFTPVFPVLGFSNVTDRAYNDDRGTVQEDSETYVFWDELHPTAMTHRLLARVALAEVTGNGEPQLEGSGIVDGDVVFAWLTAGVRGPVTLQQATNSLDFTDSVTLATAPPLLIARGATSERSQFFRLVSGE